MNLKQFLQETKILSQKEMAGFYEDLGQDEKEYVKKELKLDFKVAEGPEKVITSIDGEKETINKAEKGDYIITGVSGEKYILKPEQFNKRYFIVGNVAKTKPVKITAKQYKGKDMSFMASWGEEMILKYNDYLVRNGKEYYRIERKAFSEIYEPKN